MFQVDESQSRDSSNRPARLLRNFAMQRALEGFSRFDGGRPAGCDTPRDCEDHENGFVLDDETSNGRYIPVRREFIGTVIAHAQRKRPVRPPGFRLVKWRLAGEECLVCHGVSNSIREPLDSPDSKDHMRPARHRVPQRDPFPDTSGFLGYVSSRSPDTCDWAECLCCSDISHSYTFRNRHPGYDSRSGRFPRSDRSGPAECRTSRASSIRRNPRRRNPR